MLLVKQSGLFFLFVVDNCIFHRFTFLLIESLRDADFRNIRFKGRHILFLLNLQDLSRVQFLKERVLQDFISSVLLLFAAVPVLLVFLADQLLDKIVEVFIRRIIIFIALRFVENERLGF